MNNVKIVPETADRRVRIFKDHIECNSEQNNQIQFNLEQTELEIPSDSNFESEMQCKELPDFEHTLRDKKINIWSETLDD